ncbi:MAG: hypothetical protein DMG22_06955 [Acidobacteria bacterium]|nr:MAG: hypothetical protein DMG22_06955 [Acidobacteriota bacterium]
MSVNHRLLSDFRTDHGEALDQLLTQVVASLVDRDVVKVSRVSQDGVRVRVGAGASSFRREARLEKLLEEAKRHVEELHRRLDSPASPAAAITARQAAARKRAAREKQERLQQAIAQLPELKRRQEEAARRAGQGERGKKIREKEPRVSTTDAEARVMKMPNGGYNPAVNVQLATDTASGAIVGVEVSNQGSDSAGLSAPMREQVEKRTGGKVEEHLLDGGYLRSEDLEEAHPQGVALFVPPKPARHPQRRGQELEPKAGDSAAVEAWKQRMKSEEGKQIYKQRAATSETVKRGLAHLSRAEPHPGARAGQSPLRRALVCPGIQRDALRQGVAGVANAQSVPETARRGGQGQKTGPPAEARNPWSFHGHRSGPQKQITWGCNVIEVRKKSQTLSEARSRIGLIEW